MIIALTIVIKAECNQDGIPVTVSRRSSGDSYTVIIQVILIQKKFAVCTMGLISSVKGTV